MAEGFLLEQTDPYKHVIDIWRLPMVSLCYCNESQRQIIEVSRIPKLNYTFFIY